MGHPLQTLPCFMALLMYLRDTNILTSFTAVIGSPQLQVPLIRWSETVPNAVHKGVQMEMQIEITRCDIRTVQRAVYNLPAIAPSLKSNWQYGAL